MNNVSIFILGVLVVVAVLLCIAIMRLSEQHRRQEQQLSRTSKTITGLINRGLDLDRLLGRSLL